MRSLLNFRKGRKGQFFILTTVAVVTILFFVSRWTGSSAQVDTSSLVMSEEFFTFDNIYEKSSSVVKNSDNCDDLEYNLQEYKSFVENFARDKNYKITFDYSVVSCTTTATVQIDIVIISDKVNAQKTYSLVWP